MPEARPERLAGAGRGHAGIFLGLGSNVGDRREHLCRAIAALPGIGLEPLRGSRLYETEPVGLKARRWFFNCALECRSDLAPLQILTRLQALEWALGRRRMHRGFGPRVIDLDLLLYGSWRIATPALKLPHPGIAGRRYLLLALQELGQRPAAGRGLALPQVRRQVVRIVADDPWRAGCR